MFQLYTNRLRVVPLTLEQLQLLSTSREHLESAMGLILSNFALSADDSFMEEFQIAIDTHCIPKVQENYKDYLWYTHWLIVHRSLNITIGGIGVNGTPNEIGEVMIGYYVDEKFERQGVAAEALECMVKWLFENDSVRSIIGDTHENNIASQRVLQKNGFRLEGKVEEGLRWRLKSDMEEQVSYGV